MNFKLKKVVIKTASTISILGFFLILFTQSSNSQDENLSVRLTIINIETLAPFKNRNSASLYSKVRIGRTNFKSPRNEIGQHIRPRNWKWTHRTSLPREDKYGENITIELFNKNTRYCEDFLGVPFNCKQSVDINPSKKSSPWNQGQRSLKLAYLPSECIIQHSRGKTGGFWLNDNHCVINFQSHGTEEMRARVVFKLDIFWH